MAVRWYAMAMQEHDNGGAIWRGPKYLRWRFNASGLDVAYSLVDYGLMNVCIVWADVNNGQHNQLVSNNDCRAIVQHANVDNAVGSAASNVRAALEALLIPGNWVQTTDTWRAVLRVTIGVFQYAQRLHAKFGVKIVPDGYSLDTTWSEIPVQGQQFLLETATELGIDTSGASGSTTLRQIYRAFGEVWRDRPIVMGAVTL